MNQELEDFFKPIKQNPDDDKRDYRITRYFLSTVDALSRLSHDTLYIIDYHKREFLYVSGNPLFLCGEKPGDVEKMGYGFYQKYVMPQDLPMLLEINTAGFDFYYEIDSRDRLNYFISYDFHLMHPNGRQILINHKLTPLALDTEKNIWLALCVVKPSAAKSSGNIFITGGGKRGVYEYDLKKKEWSKVRSLKLSAKAKEVLLLSTQGYNTDDIARELSVTAATIKFHRKNIFRMLGVKNISEAITCAQNYHLL